MFCLFLSTKMHKTTNLSKIRFNLNIRFVKIRIQIKSRESTKKVQWLNAITFGLSQIIGAQISFAHINDFVKGDVCEWRDDLKGRGRWFCDYNLCNNKHYKGGSETVCSHCSGLSWKIPKHFKMFLFIAILRAIKKDDFFAVCALSPSIIFPS